MSWELENRRNRGVIRPEGTGWRTGFLTSEGSGAYEAMVKSPRGSALILDCDGTLWASGVKWPNWPEIAPRLRGTLEQAKQQFGTVALLTGRSVEQLRRLGLVIPGITILGQFGAECLDRDGELLELVAVPKERSRVVNELRGKLEYFGIPEEQIEMKSHAVAVHYAGDTDPEKVLELHRWLKELAGQAEMAFLPGDRVVELGPFGVDKGRSLRWFLDRETPDAALFAGDSGPDASAFKVLLDRRRDRGMNIVNVCTSDYGPLLNEADVAVDGWEGMLDLLTEMCILASR
ncbi:trehalose-phosphatase [Actinomadura scrupuli]|uniref:trehalose-phosphatase n=1 Tax=Actinomadura scrupuli TaxID=559629 RepID=UPI003D98B5BB